MQCLQDCPGVHFSSIWFRPFAKKTYAQLAADFCLRVHRKSLNQTGSELLALPLVIGDVSFQGSLCLGQIQALAPKTHLLLFDDSEECSNDNQKLLLCRTNRNGTAICAFVPPVKDVIESALLIPRQPSQCEKPRSILALTRQISVDFLRES